ncbi:sugar MFS transporter [Granulicella sp. L60]|uniref:sugar MFS transporter n=1 Tax=Granulicella sp. L60 TaxID=1641866 RepID=UPI0020B128C7|nr:sugar MFS transporter [Granulicella sp. L60]
MITAAPQNTLTRDPQSTDVRAMSIATVLFFMWGFLTCLNDILIPHLKGIFDLSYGKALLVQFAFFSSYFIFALPSAKLVEWRGYKQTMVIGLVVMATGALLFLPAATLASFPLFLSALVILAAGITGLQVSANPYVTNLGPQATSASRLNLAQAFNSLGTTVAPFIGGALILGAAAAVPDNVKSLSGAMLQDYRAQQASTVRLPYLVIALLLLALATGIGLIKLPTTDFTRDFRPGELKSSAKGSIWSNPYLLMGALGIFVYVGAEVSIGSFLINYLGLPQIMSYPEQTAAHFVAFYWGGAMIGRFIGSYVLRFVSTGKALAAAAFIACALVALTMMSTGHIAMVSVLLVGFFNSIMFPSIFSLGLAGLGELTSKGSSLMVAAIVGGALIPLAEGFLADRVGVQHAFILPAICYVYIAIFGIVSSRRKDIDLDPARAT